jgi:hypothetical protein
MFAEPVWRFPFVGMVPGDSFCIPTNDADHMKMAIKREAKKFGIRVKTKIRVEEGVLVVRCWALDDKQDG